ncbi:MAG: FAD/NAD(P)-binding oxidoreductase [Actinobacteria bacterium HGW-Actinobacteria-4]|nr:MAG: FAD/NAD(P)-binding oxidoreductase [Actinobacteria bacterium HGW-Actinobacteria-4]
MTRIVVIGHGMVGSRFAEEVVETLADADVTVLGKEPQAAYNRVLLSSVVSGVANPESLTIAGPDHPRVATLTGVSAVKVDRAARTVIDSAGAVHDYDFLVFATGSVARIPAIQGVADSDGFVSGVAVLKDMADAQDIVKHALSARRAVVLGAGVLGLEVATGLAKRGVAVRVVHHADRLMERQLGWEASAVATTSLTKLGIDVHTGVSLAGAQATRGKLSSVRLEDGSEVLTDMLVMCCGTIPETSLARQAGLEIDRGIVVGDDLATPRDPAIFAIGDCAQPPGGGTGLVAQGWEQSSRLAARLAGVDGVTASEPRSTDVVRVKASGLSMATMGVSGDFDRADPRLRVLSLKDPEGGRFIEVVVSGGLLVGATCIGDKAIAADLATLYTRKIPVPSDPAQLLIHALAGQASAAKDPAEMADDDIVCNCNSVSKGAICTAVAEGCDTVAGIAKATRATTGCGDCAALVAKLVTAPSTPTAAPAATERAVP